MKCEKCGGNLTLEDVVCPHCDALNEHAVQHIRDMNRYKKEFEGTKEEVYSVTKSYAGITVRIIIIAVLIILTVICGLVSGEAYSIRRNIRRAEANRNADEYKQRLEQYLADRDYYAFAAFCDENSIDTYEGNYTEYNHMIFATRYYSYIYDYIMGTLNPYEGMNMQNNIKWISDNLTEFYKIYNASEYSYYYIGDSEEKWEMVLEVQEQIHALLIAYCGLTQEEVDAFPNMSDAQRAVLLEERILDGK